MLDLTFLDAQNIRKFNLIVLNQKIEMSIFQQVLDLKPSKMICADGGAKRLYKAL